MKPLIRTFLIIFGFFISASCEKRSINQREGMFIGEAEVLRTRTLDSAGRRSEQVIFDGTFIDTFEVEVIDVEERKYSIKRSGYSGGLYDIGSPRFEYELDEEFFWGGGYTYDKKWVSRLNIENKDLLLGYMLVEDKFGSEQPPDSLGNYSTEYYFYEYRISASRQK